MYTDPLYFLCKALNYKYMSVNFQQWPKDSCTCLVVFHNHKEILCMLKKLESKLVLNQWDSGAVVVVALCLLLNICLELYANLQTFIIC